ncbi:Isochorismatase-like protein [Mycena olivaceomarginata]|nr:Isochorismatase-like protein [Mycena olivaceomarginata]
MGDPKRCLLLVDLQNEFLSPTGNFPIAETWQLALLENVSKAVRDFRASGDAVCWVRSDPTASVLHFRTTITALQAAQDLVLTKTWYSAFTDTALRDELTARGITNVYMRGLLTNVCVRATAEGAHALGFPVTVLEDCSGFRKYRSHKQALSQMQEQGIREPALYYVNGSIPSWRVLMALYEKEISFTPIRLKVMSDPKETRSPAFLKLNHRGKTPVLVDPLPRTDDSTETEKVTINESIAILQYIEMYYRPDKPLLPPISERSARALVLARIQETENLHKHIRQRSGEPLDPEERAMLVANVHAELDYWEVYATGSAYIAGDEFGLADCAFFPQLAYMLHRGFDWERPVKEEPGARRDPDAWPHLRAYFEWVWEQKGCAKRAQPAGWDQRSKVNVWRGEG